MRSLYRTNNQGPVTARQQAYAFCTAKERLEKILDPGNESTKCGMIIKTPR